MKGFFQILLMASCALFTTLAPHAAHAQKLSTEAEAWGQTYRPAGILNLESRAYAYPWIRAEAQVWTGESPLATQGNGDVVVLAAHLRDPTGHGEMRAGRFVLTTGAIRPVHMDGAYVRGQLDSGTAVEGFSGVPVTPRWGSRAYDWFAGARLSQRFSEWGAVGASYVQRRDRGREIDEEVGADLVFYPTRRLTLSGRSSYDLVSAGLSEINVTSSLGKIDQRAEAFFVLRNPSLILPATSLFSVLSNSPSQQVGVTGRTRVAPRLRLDGIAAMREASGEVGARLELGANLWLDDLGEGSVDGRVTRDGVAGSQWTGVRVVVGRDVIEDLRLISELELVIPDDDEQGSMWPWGRLAARYTLREHWKLSAGVEGSSSPQFQKLFQALFSVAYQLGAT